MNIIRSALIGVFTLSVGLTGCKTLQNQPETADTNKTPKALEQKNADGPTALMQAVAAGDMEKVRDLIDAGQSVNTSTPQGSALTWAVNNKNLNAAMYLLSIGANPNVGIQDGQASPLMLVAAEGETQMVKLMLAAGADVNYADSKGDTAISKAAYEGHLTTVKTLLKIGADVNITPSGRSLLMHIVSNNDLLISQVLIAAGADVNYRDADGGTALAIAQRKGYGDLEMLLVQAGADS